VDEAISAVEEQRPPVVALGNLAGISDPGPFLEVTLEEWERVFAVNVRGAFLTTRRVLPGMIDRHLGRIVCVSSISAQRGGGTLVLTQGAAARSRRVAPRSAAITR
jgi:2-hydroxycyclohexanecarboxyl-CoA dehydrogenase